MTDVPVPSEPAVPAEPLEPDEKPTYLDLRPNGGIHLVVEGEKRRLRPPRLRDYRKLVALWRDNTEEMNELRGQLENILGDIIAVGQARETRIAAEKEAGNPTPVDMTAEERQQDRQFTRDNQRLGNEVQEMSEAACVTWWCEVVATLGVTDSDREVDAEDLPVFCTQVDVVTEVVNHWRNRPSLSGVR